MATATETSPLKLVPSDLPIAQLPTVSLNRLENGSLEEDENLIQACRTHGFFYLDLNGSNVSPLLDKMYELTRELYDLPEEEKRKYDVDKLSDMKLNGYKPMGRNFGGLSGQRDGFETYAIPKTGVMGLAGQQNFARPAVIDKYMATLQEFARFITSANTTTLASISKSLQLADNENLTTCHRPSMPSPDIIRLLKYSPQPAEERGFPHAAHTDLGSLTFLFTLQPGLQVLEDGSKEWEWVQPREGHAIVNLGDGMSLLTNGHLKSCLHRVGPLPGHPMPTRYSFAYMVRPEDHTVMTGVKSPFIPARLDETQPVFSSGDWLKKKFNVLRSDSRPHSKTPNWVMTGRQEAVA